MAKDKNDYLAINDMSGPDLIKVGIEAAQKQLSDRVVSFITGTINQIRETEKQAEYYAGRAEWHRKRLKAIHDNEFKINNDGLVVFNNRSLNEEGRQP